MVKVKKDGLAFITTLLLFPWVVGSYDPTLLILMMKISRVPLITPLNAK